MTQFSLLSVHQILWHCAILNLLLCNTCLSHRLLQFLYSDMDLVYNCKYSKDKISTLVILRDAVHRTKFNRFRRYCLMCNHAFAFLRSSSEERRIYGDLLLVTAARTEGPSEDNGQLQNVLAFLDENKFLDRNSNAGIFCPLICRMLRNSSA